MIGKTIIGGVTHKVPVDLKEILISKPDVLEKWKGLTSLARNEWICWVTIVKRQETRKEHLVRLCEDLLKGKRRPCCWPGCPHRRESAKKWFK
ncbi:YdeI/OmpD-associated family protein [Candidatus Microgenomates bacterium]|nr:YdeI/OmpD-associated family protein [Candidatus Microgenomates bacterium]